MFCRDWFHALVQAHAWQIFVVVSVLYFGSWLGFAPLYMAVNRQCNLGSTTFLSALYYSAREPVCFFGGGGGRLGRNPLAVFAHFSACVSSLYACLFLFASRRARR